METDTKWERQLAHVQTRGCGNQEGKLLCIFFLFLYFDCVLYIVLFVHFFGESSSSDTCVHISAICILSRFGFEANVSLLVGSDHLNNNSWAYISFLVRTVWWWCGSKLPTCHLPSSDALNAYCLAQCILPHFQQARARYIFFYFVFFLHCTALYNFISINQWWMAVSFILSQASCVLCFFLLLHQFRCVFFLSLIRYETDALAWKTTHSCTDTVETR